jgi:hypothetical protein
MKLLHIEGDAFHPEWNIRSSRASPQNRSGYPCGCPKMR